MCDQLSSVPLQGVMVRLMLVLAPIMCILGGIAINGMYFSLLFCLLLKYEFVFVFNIIIPGFSASC